ncbi:MAG: hypothetical protein CM1200mP25_0280 [Acidobacteriota bacterium]|nr:MAG: hypothetical protein CM1200mP25_0280 [Acidobacteriota bacterium]
MGQTDGTLDIVEHYCANNERIPVVRNIKRSAASGLNCAINSTTAQVIIRVDAHSFVKGDFIAQSVKLLQDHPEAWCVGGPIVHFGEGAMGRAIAMAMAIHLASEMRNIGLPIMKAMQKRPPRRYSGVRPWSNLGCLMRNLCEMKMMT